jgi:hypothetical protein
MPTVTPKSYYYSGNGVLWAARVGPDGFPMGYRHMGNCPEVSVTVELAFSDRERMGRVSKEFTDGKIVGLKGSLDATLESLSDQNIAWLSGFNVETQQARAIAAAVWACCGAYAPLEQFVDATLPYSAAIGAQALTKYTTPTAPWDYGLDEDGGLVYFNNGVLADLDKLKLSGIPVTGWVRQGNGTLRLTVAANAAMVAGAGGVLVDSSLKLAGAPLPVRITGSGVGFIDTDIIADKNTPPFIGVGGKFVPDRLPVTVSYTSRKQSVVAGGPQAVQLWAFMFVGLNTVDGKYVTLRMPAAYMNRSLRAALINDDIASLPLQATLLPSPLHALPTLVEVERETNGFYMLTPDPIPGAVFDRAVTLLPGLASAASITVPGTVFAQTIEFIPGKAFATSITVPGVVLTQTVSFIPGAASSP